VIDEDQFTAAGPTGFKFGPVTTENLVRALQRAHLEFRNKPAWRQIQKNGMRTDVSWRDRARSYAELYRAAVS
jgi:starch synthase